MQLHPSTRPYILWLPHEHLYIFYSAAISYYIISNYINTVSTKQPSYRKTVASNWTQVFRRLRNGALENKAFETELLGSEQTYERTPATAVRVRANPVPVIRVLWVAIRKCSCLRLHQMSGKMHACGTLEKGTHFSQIPSVHFICLTLVTVTNALNNTTSWQVSILQLRGIRRYIKTFHRNRGN